MCFCKKKINLPPKLLEGENELRPAYPSSEGRDATYPQLRARTTYLEYKARREKSVEILPIGENEMHHFMTRQAYPSSDGREQPTLLVKSKNDFKDLLTRRLFRIGVVHQGLSSCSCIQCGIVPNHYGLQVEPAAALAETKEGPAISNKPD